MKPLVVEMVMRLVVDENKCFSNLTSFIALLIETLSCDYNSYIWFIWDEFRVSLLRSEDQTDWTLSWIYIGSIECDIYI